MVKVAVLTNAFKEKELITGCIEQFKPFNLFHLVLCPRSSWNGNMENDDTCRVAFKSGASVCRMNWRSATDQFNWGLKFLKDYDWVLLVDADERYSYEGIKELLSILPDVHEPVIKTNNWHVYWKTPDYEIVPEQTDYPVIAVKPSVKITNIRNPEGVPYGWVNIPMYHYSYVRSDDDMWKKIKTFEASKEFEVEKWYSEIWSKWTPGMRNLHPVNPPQFEKAVYRPAPEGIVL